MLPNLRRPSGTIRVSAARERRVITLRVRDTGKGIPAALLDHLFDLFVQAPDEKGMGGLDIGLSVVRRLVDLHGGIRRSIACYRAAVTPVPPPKSAL